MIKLQTKLHKIHIPIYKDALFIFFGTREDCQKALVKSTDMKLEEALCFRPSNTAQGYFCYFEKDGIYIIWMPNIPDTVGQYGVLVHEIMHFVYRFLAERGMTMNDNSEEAYTYLAEYIFNEIDTYIVNLKENI